MNGNKKCAFPSTWMNTRNPQAHASDRCAVLKAARRIGDAIRRRWKPSIDQMERASVARIGVARGGWKIDGPMAVWTTGVSAHANLDRGSEPSEHETRRSAHFGSTVDQRTSVGRGRDGTSFLHWGPEHCGRRGWGASDERTPCSVGVTVMNSNRATALGVDS
jgi:hypothetical protein